MKPAIRATLLSVLTASAASAQSIKGAVLAKHEPHHHLVYEDAAIRVLRVRVAPHDTTLLHEHDPDYFWIALGPSEVVNAKLGAPDATITSQDLSIHYTPGNFAHVARNPGTLPFDNITVEVLGAQTNVRNLCEAAVGGKELHCAAPSVKLGTGVTEHPAFETDQMRVSLVSLEPGAVMRPTPRSAGVRIIALDTNDVRYTGIARWTGGVNVPSGATWSLANDGRKPIRALVVTATPRR